LTFFLSFLYFRPSFEQAYSHSDKAGLLSERKGQTKFDEYLYTATTKPRPSR
jgi:hypothetical protein